MPLYNWMKELDSSRKVFSFNIPGSHDSAAQYVHFPMFSRCQDRSIYEQLMMGVRSLDIRVAAEQERLILVHGNAKIYCRDNGRKRRMAMKDVLDDCFRFLDQYPSETVIFQFKNDSMKEMEKCFDYLFDQHIKGNEERWYINNRIPTLGEARGKLILVRRCNINRTRPELKEDHMGIDFSGWAEQDEAVPHALPLLTHSEDGAVFLIQDRYTYQPRARWEECILPFLAERKPFDGTYIINYLSTAGGLKGPRRNAKYINRRFEEVPLDKEKYYGTIYIDFPYERLTKKIISSNF